MCFAVCQCLKYSLNCIWQYYRIPSESGVIRFTSVLTQSSAVSLYLFWAGRCPNFRTRFRYNQFSRKLVCGWQNLPIHQYNTESNATPVWLFESKFAEICSYLLIKNLDGGCITSTKIALTKFGQQPQISVLKWWYLKPNMNTFHDYVNKITSSPKHA